MDRPCHPVKAWLQSHDHDLAWLSDKLNGSVTAESLRMIVSGYRLPSWDLAFDIEALTCISAHEIRDARYYHIGEAA